MHMGSASSEPPQYGTPMARLWMYTMMCSYIIALKTVRAAISSLVPILGLELGFSETALAYNLSAFFAGVARISVV